RVRAEWIIETVRRIGIFREPDVAAGSPQPFHIGFAGSDRVVVIARAVKYPDRPIGHLGVGDEGGHAVGIERHISHELRARLVPKLMKTLEAPVERGLAAAREAHERDARRIDARMLGDDLERAIDIDYEVEPTEQRLVGAHAGETAAGEAIDYEGRDPHFIELSRPHVDVGAN